MREKTHGVVAKRNLQEQCSTSERIQRIRIIRAIRAQYLYVYRVQMDQVVPCDI